MTAYIRNVLVEEKRRHVCDVSTHRLAKALLSLIEVKLADHKKIAFNHGKYSIDKTAC